MKLFRVEDGLPDTEKHVFAYYRNALNKKRRVIAKLIGQFESESTDDLEDCEYSEEDDKYYVIPGWYEVIDNWDDFSCVRITEDVTHWQELPPWPSGV